MATVSMGADGRLTIPAEIRRRLGLTSEAELEYEVDPSTDAIVLRPVVTLRREDAWAYTTDHRASLARAHADSREGRLSEMTESELAKLGNDE